MIDTSYRWSRLAPRRWLPILCVVPLCLAALGCGGKSEAAGDTPSADGGGGDRRAGGGREGRGQGRGGSPGFGDTGRASSTAIPVDVAPVVRRDIANHLETNGTLEAENEVDVVARINGPIVELLVEEGDFVRQGQLLVRIDAAEIQAQLGIARVSLEEARLSLERARASLASEIISQEVFDLAKSRYDTAEAQIRGHEIQLSYTEIRAPFAGLIIERAIKFAEHVSNGSRLFRISDFDPLLCPIQIPEKDLSRLRLGQPAYLTVEAFADERFVARVLRISPVVSSATGTIEVTLSVRGQGRLRPGMFASIFLETDIHRDALVVPRTALVLESIGDSLYVVEGEVARRREVEVGYVEAEAVEIVSGVSDGEKVVVVGQDAISDGTAVYVVGEEGAAPTPVASSRGPAAATGGPSPNAAAPPTGRGDGAAAGAGREGAGPGGRFGPGGFQEIDWDDPQQVERIKGMMRQRGLSEDQIEQRLQRMRQGGQRPAGGQRPPGGARPSPPPGGSA